MMTELRGKNLAKLIYDYISEHPEQHNQEVYFEETACGTTYCIAGFAAVVTGNAKPVLDNQGVSYLQVTNPEYVGPLKFEYLGADLLELYRDEACSIFHCFNNEMAREAVRYIANGKQIDWAKIREEFGSWRPLFTDSRFSQFNYDTDEWEILPSIFTEGEQK